MNRERIEGNWLQWKGKARETWGRFAHDDVAIYVGKREQITGRIRERNGIFRDDVERTVSAFLASQRDLIARR